MTDARIKGHFRNHPKVARLSLSAKGLWLEGLLYSLESGTDFVPWDLLPDIEAIAAELLDAGLWHIAPGGYEIHDFYQWNPAPDKRRLLADAVRRAAEIDETAWDKSYERQITQGHLDSQISPDEVYQITRYILEGWATSKERIVGIPKFETIVKTRGSYLLAAQRPKSAANYFAQAVLNGSTGNSGDSRHHIHGLARANIPGRAGTNN